MIFKVHYQPDTIQAPVREKTRALYIEAGSETAVRQALGPKGYNIESIIKLSDAYLAYEQEHAKYEIVSV
ncbi:DNA-dependent RNA polymerase subunit epsilon [Shouchella lonarensis]|uniref:DNA-directed RNA polymerase subunit epsilon n=1 Tax=Shouchella lonarensis TaxID=1464122 RepID=A0A1G6ISG6_9BACI|nr:RNA polymerase epsilon subunit [Shouchella lonarensis]SDC09370.1 DNA-dependent RNA polymerase auxiliary subunit epsilon [Shouchella lonarensis]